jgi:hypothetical protein
MLTGASLPQGLSASALRCFFDVKGCPVSCGMVNNISGLYPIDSPQVMTIIGLQALLKVS